jgi:hypothetical protein
MLIHDLPITRYYHVSIGYNNVDFPFPVYADPPATPPLDAFFPPGSVGLNERVLISNVTMVVNVAATVITPPARVSLSITDRNGGPPASPGIYTNLRVAVPPGATGGVADFRLNNQASPVICDAGVNPCFSLTINNLTGTVSYTINLTATGAIIMDSAFLQTVLLKRTAPH